MYLSVDQELNLYYGNTGAFKKIIGNLKTINLDKIVEEIKELKPNYAYSAYYDIHNLLKSHEIIDEIYNHIYT